MNGNETFIITYCLPNCTNKKKVVRGSTIQVLALGGRASPYGPNSLFYVKISPLFRPVLIISVVAVQVTNADFLFQICPFDELYFGLLLHN